MRRSVYEQRARVDMAYLTQTIYNLTQLYPGRGMQDYCRYLPLSSEDNPWSVEVSAAGFTRIRPGGPYPPLLHPLDHLFTWSTGRVLPAYQLVYILEGKGSFESGPTGRVPILPGTLFLLFPQIWHRYKPDAKSGWVESYLELRGPAIQRLQDADVLLPAHAVYPLGIRTDLVELFSQCHHLAYSLPAGAQPVLAMLAMQILARLNLATAAPRAPSDSDTLIRQAQDLLARSLDQPLQMEQLAQNWPVSYSYFRRLFRSRLGVSPKQYHLQLRLRKAQDLQSSTTLSIEQIAQTLAFSSPFHFSHAFRLHTGITPSQWRHRATKAIDGQTPSPR